MDTGIFTRGSPRERSCHGQQGPEINETKYLQAVIKTTVVTTNAMTVKVERQVVPMWAFDSVVE